MSDDFWGIYNSFQIQDMKVSQGSQQRLSEFQERVQNLGQKTGTQPTGFFAFERANPTPRGRSKSMKWVLGLLGAAFAITASATFPVIAAVGVGGFFLGSLFPESEPERFARAIERYDQQLTQWEMRASQVPSRGVTVSYAPDEAPLSSVHVDRELERRAKASELEKAL